DLLRWRRKANCLRTVFCPFDLLQGWKPSTEDMGGMPVDSDGRFRRLGFYRRLCQGAQYSCTRNWSLRRCGGALVDRGGACSMCACGGTREERPCRSAAAVLRGWRGWATLFGSSERFHAVSFASRTPGMTGRGISSEE